MGKNYKHVTVISDIIIAVSYVNNKGRIKCELLNKIARDLWVSCASQNMWVSAAHLLENKILRQAVFLETSIRLLSGN